MKSGCWRSSGRARMRSARCGPPSGSRRPRFRRCQRGADRRDRPGQARLVRGFRQRGAGRPRSRLLDPQSGRPFRFCEAYNPEGRTEIASTRREWRVLSLLAPSLGLDPNSNVYPFSVKPDKPVSPATIMEIFRDTYEGTAFDVVKDLTVVDAGGKTVRARWRIPSCPTT